MASFRKAGLEPGFFSNVKKVTLQVTALLGGKARSVDLQSTCTRLAMGLHSPVPPRT